jgi:2'-5' RNA ligase
MRAFFALPMPDPLCEALAALRADVGRARWTPPAQLHLTLRFLGELDPAWVEPLRAAVLERRRADDWPPLRIRARGLQRFGSAPHPRVLWTAVEPAEPIRRIAEQLEAAAQAVGLPGEERPFRPHVTLARLTRPDPERVAALLERYAGLTTSEHAVSEVVLYESILTPHGAIHRALHTFALGSASRT